MGLGEVPELTNRIRPFRNGKDLTDRPRGLWLIDLFGLTEDDVRRKFPRVYQWVLERVKPERDVNRRTRLREHWWTFGEPRQGLRSALKGLPRYIATVETAKHRTFQFLDTKILPDHKLVAIACSDALALGVLSSQLHAVWALAAGGTLEDRPVYSKSRCFDPFPFPDEDTGLTRQVADQIRSLAEQLDAHRKSCQSAHDSVTITGMYNVMVKLRSGQDLTAAEKKMNEQGLVSVLQQLHIELDVAVLQAYGWSDLVLPTDLDTLLLRLVDLNAKRATEELNGTIRWVRPDFQCGNGLTEQSNIEEGGDDDDEEDANAGHAPTKWATIPPRQWPNTLPEQIRAVADLLSTTSQALNIDGVAARFSGRGRWRERLPTILDTLVALGRARMLTGEVRWIGIGA